MKLMRLAMCVAAFAVIGKIALSEDVDVRALQAKLAAQEARLNDLQAKINAGGPAYSAGQTEGLVSINKNAVVTIGGTVNTRYFYRGAKIESPVLDYGFDSDYEGPADAAWGFGGNGTWRTVAKASESDLKISDAKLRVKVDVNDYFDAFLQVDLQSSADGASDNAEIYWVRWKNVCNSGFGVLVGRAPLVFGVGGYGVLGSYAAGGGDGLAEVKGGAFEGPFATIDDGDYIGGTWIPPHNGWDIGRVTQVTPYWEGLDGKIKFELSFMQGVDNRFGGKMSSAGWNYAEWNTPYSGAPWWTADPYYKSHNYGFGTMSARLGVKPIEGMLISASAINYYNRHLGTDKFPGEDYPFYKKNNTAIDLAFSYRPAFFNKLNIWAQWIHGWNVNNINNLDSDAVNFGASFDFNESWTIFAQGDYLRSKLGNGIDVKGTAWAAYGGIQYKLPYGAMLEAGWKHEWVDYKWDGYKVMKINADTIYAHLGFDF